MSRQQKLLIAFFVSLCAIIGGGIGHFAWRATHIIVIPAPPVQQDIQSEILTKRYVAALDVARVFGRAPGCADADSKLITDIATEAINDNLDPRILAATVAVESACDPFAVSPRGAIGLTQVVPRVWKAKFDFTHVNLLNPAENLHAGATILSDLIKQYGVAGGVRRYQGTGVACPSCDDSYVPKILALAGRKS